ncbi:MAG: substrate-binding domain-containing protein [Clostridiales bacterium]|nr:substrate-binding domain-containing protein [Clostridiales bacterium]
MKKMIMLIIVIMISLVSCHEETELEDSRKIAFMISTLENPFFHELSQHAEIEANKVDIDLVILDSKNSVDIEKENFINLKNIDVIILNPVDSELSSDIVLLANKKGIKVITVDRQVTKGYVVSHIESDNYLGGQMAGEFIESLLRKDDNILMLEGIQDTTANDMRIQGITDYFDDNEIDVQYTEIANFNRKEAELLLLKDNLINEIDVAFAANDEMALGILDAARQVNHFVTIIGFDGTKEAIDAVSNGYMAGTITQQPDLLAKYSIKAACDISKGLEISSSIKVKLKLVSIKSQ